MIAYASRTGTRQNLDSFDGSVWFKEYAASFLLRNAGDVVSCFTGAVIFTIAIDMPTEHDLKQAAIDTLHEMMKPGAKALKVKGELALGIIEEMREAVEARQPPEWVQQLYAETAIENERERRNRWRD